jgi:hypothetical protein
MQSFVTQSIKFNHADQPSSSESGGALGKPVG